MRKNLRNDDEQGCGALQLRERAAAMEDDGTLLVDIPHPERRICSLMVATDTQRIAVLSQVLRVGWNTVNTRRRWRRS